MQMNRRKGKKTSRQPNARTNKPLTGTRENNIVRKRSNTTRLQLDSNWTPAGLQLRNSYISYIDCFQFSHLHTLSSPLKPNIMDGLQSNRSKDRCARTNVQRCSYRSSNPNTFHLAPHINIIITIFFIIIIVFIIIFLHHHHQDMIHQTKEQKVKQQTKIKLWIKYVQIMDATRCSLFVVTFLLHDCFELAASLLQ